MCNIYEKLQAARVELQNKKLKKSGKNKFAGFDYFELADIIPSINQIFYENKIFSQFCINEGLASLTIINAEKPEECITFTTPIAELELKGCNAIQALGGVNTYCRRYLYLNALEIVEADLFDAEAGKKTVNQQDTKPVINPDFDIIDGIKAINDIENLEIYYWNNIKSVKDEKAFNTAVTKRKKELSK